MNYVNVNNPLARKEVLNMIETFDLKDTYRHFYPDKRRYTWRRTNPIKQARLDYFIVSMLDLISNSKIIPGYKTDHSIIQIVVCLNTFTRGRGIWKCNTSLLKDKKYVNLI